MGDHSEPSKISFPSSANVRRWIYGIGITAAPVLVAYGLVEADKVPLWVSLLGAVLGIGNIVALGNVTDK